jgi:hypothetical protein
MGHPAYHLIVAISPSAEGEVQSVSGQPWHGGQQHQRVAQEDDDGGKKIPLAGDVRLPGSQYLYRQRDVKGVGRAEQQMKPRQISVPPMPEQIAEEENQHDHHGVEWEEIRRQRDAKIIINGAPTDCSKP